MDVPSVVHFILGADPQIAIGSTQDFITNFQNEKKKKKFAHDNFKLDYTGGEFSKMVENTMEKGGKMHGKTKSPLP